MTKTQEQLRQEGLRAARNMVRKFKAREKATNNTKENGMIQIENATVETLDQNQGRPIGSTVLAVTIGDHTFQMLVDENELIEALATQYK